MPRLLRGLLGLPLLWKVLLANSLIVVSGAVVGTVLTARFVRMHPDVSEFDLLAVMALAGLLISLAVNLFAVRAALSPLRQLRATIDAVRAGDHDARVHPGLVTDPEVDRVGGTLNGMLDELGVVQGKLRTLSAAIINAQEEERRRISRELHDDTAQALTSLLLYAKALEQGDAPPAVRAALAEVREEVARSLEGVRRLARELRPSALDDLGLVAALEGYTQDLARRARLPISFDHACGGDRLPPKTELALYRIAQEALTNVAKHASATSVEVRLVREPGACTLTVADDGRGFNQRTMETISPAGRGIGLFGMRERAELAGGMLDILTAPGRGTRVRARVPLGPALGR